MKPIRLAALLAFAGLLGPALLQAQQEPKPAESPSPAALDNGTILYLELSKTVDAKKAKVGDVVSAVLLADVLSHGKVAFRQDTRLVGHVTEVQSRTKENPESRLGVAFDKIVPKSGQEAAFNSVLIALRPAPPIQMATISGPTPPGTNAPPQERHYPMPTPKTPKFNSTLDRDSHAPADDVRASDIEGLSLTPSPDGSNRVVISYKQNVKLEAGVRLELRVGSQPK